MWAGLLIVAVLTIALGIFVMYFRNLRDGVSSWMFVYKRVRDNVKMYRTRSRTICLLAKSGSRWVTRKGVSLCNPLFLRGWPTGYFGLKKCANVDF